uniref:Uncharacterized protein n=1 Tax=Solanum tuberosum TaxID=4113 RepID=M1D7M1_SOLTU
MNTCVYSSSTKRLRAAHHISYLAAFGDFLGWLHNENRALHMMSTIVAHTTQESPAK